MERPKPFPDIYLKAAEKLQVKPENCIVFEDSPTGVEAGRCAGYARGGRETTPAHFDHIDFHILNFNDERLETWLAQQPSY